MFRLSIGEFEVFRYESSSPRDIGDIGLRGRPSKIILFTLYLRSGLYSILYFFKNEFEFANRLQGI